MQNTQKNTPTRLSAVYIFLYFNLQKMIRRPSWRLALAKLEALTRPSKTRELDTDKSKTMFEALKSHGHTGDINPLSGLQIKEMYDFLMKEEMLEYRSADTNAYTFDNVPRHWSTAYYPIETLIRAPHLFKLANNPDILSVIENTFGCKPEIGVIQAMWRFPSDNEPVNDELWHRDFETLRLVKCFLYLTDVDANSGPHKFVETSHTRNKKTKIGKGIKSDDHLEMAYGKEKIVTKLGPAGTCFLEETIGWHKGTKPTTKPRLMVQVVYSINPVKYKDRKPIARNEIIDHESAHYDEHIFKNHIVPMKDDI
jgi:hypothetical protein